MTFQELVALTKRHLVEEYAPNAHLLTDRETYNYFRSLATPPPPVETKVVVQPKAYKPPEPAKKAAIPSAPEPKIEQTVQPQPKTPPKIEAAASLENDTHDFSAVRAALKEAASHLKIVEMVPDDSIAKRIAASWKETLPEVLIIQEDINDEQQSLLQKICDAIQTLGYSAKVLASDIPWESLLTCPHLKLILITQQMLQKYPAIQQKYRYDQSRKRHYLDGILLCPLPSIDKLQQDPESKAQLWQAIRQLLK